MARRGTLLAYIRAQSDTDAPMVPSTWAVTLEDDHWCTVYPMGREARPDVSFHARLIVRRTGFTPHRALFLCVGLPGILQRLADRIAADGLAFTRTWSDLPSFRADVGATATSLRTEFPDERARDALDQPIGVLVALHRRMAGFDGDDGEGGPVT